MLIIGDKRTAHVLLGIMDLVGRYAPNRSRWEGKPDASPREAVFFLFSLHFLIVPHDVLGAGAWEVAYAYHLRNSAWSMICSVIRSDNL